jgi:hypothetical protein
MNIFTEILYISTGNISRMPYMSLKHDQFHGNYTYAYGKCFKDMSNFSVNFALIAIKSCNSDGVVVQRQPIHPKYIMAFLLL